MHCRPNTCDNGCPIELPGDCIYYSGPETTFLEIPSGSYLNDVIIGIDDYLASLQEFVDAIEYQNLAYAPDSGELSITHGNSVFLPIPVNADWNSTEGLSEILNKPVLSEVALTGNYDDLLNLPDLNQYYLASNPAGYITSSYVTWDNVENKPTFATVATSGSYNDLTDTPPIPPGQVQSNWTELNNSLPSFILNKPVLATVATTGSYNDLDNLPDLDQYYLASNPEGYISGITSSMVITALGYTPVTNARTLTINGVAQDLSTDRTWTINAVDTASNGLSVTGGTNVKIGGSNISENTNLIINSGISFSLAKSETGSFTSSLAFTGNGITTKSQISPAGRIATIVATNNGTVDLQSQQNGSSGGVTSRIILDGTGTTLYSDVFINTTASATGAYILPVINSSSRRVESLTGYPASIITSGTIATARLGSGTANSTTALFGDQTYKTVLTSFTETDPTAIKNQTSEQASANFNISGNGTIAGTTTTPNLTSPIGNDLSINTPDSQMVSVNIGAVDMVHITNDGVAIGGTVPNSLRASKLEVEGNVWATDAYILGSGTTPIGEFGLNGDIFVRSIGTQDIEFLTNSSQKRLSIVHSTGNVVVEGQIQIRGGTPGIGKVLMDSDGTGLAEWTTIGGGTGTVTSVGLTSSDITVGGTSPITTTGTYTLTLPNINSNTGTFNNVTVNAKGQVTAASNVSYLTSYTETDPVVSARTLTLTQGTGITLTNSGVAQSLGASRSWTITNSAPDQTVILNNGTGITVTGTYPNFTITNNSPFITTSGSYIRNQNASAQSSSNFIIDGTGTGANFIATGAAALGAGRMSIGATTGGGVVEGFSYNGTSWISGGLNFESTGSFFNSGDVTIEENLQVNGTVTSTGGGFNSARSLKTDIRTFTKSAISIIKKIPVKEFKYIKGHDNNVIGFIADEVPSEVLMDGREAMDIYSTLGILIKGIQELNDKIDGLVKSTK